MRVRAGVRGMTVMVGAGALLAALGGAPASASGQTGRGAQPELSGPVTGGSPGKQANSVPKEILRRYNSTEQEYFISGDATRYEPVGELTPDGKWDVQPAGEAPYKTRVVVRRPKNLDDFNGTVVVEWLNVTAGVDADPDFGMLHPVLLDQGFAYVGVSAQKVSIDGEGFTLNIPGAPTALLQPLTKIDPERYGSLSHPGDDYSYDIVTQVGRLARGGKLLGGKRAKHVVLAGESQSAGRLTTYIDAVQPVAEVYDGFLVHSRGAAGAALAADAPKITGPTSIRPDLDAKVLMFETETDLVGLHYIPARQPDTDRVRTWEVAGTAHADKAIAEYGRRSVGTDFDLTGICGEANDGPQPQVLRAAFVALSRWVTDDKNPPTSPRMDTSGEAIVRAEDGIAVGGIRTPVVDAPVAIMTGENHADSAICRLFGSNDPLTPEQLADRYPSHADYVSAVTKSADAAVKKGFLLRADRNSFVADAKAANVPA